MAAVAAAHGEDRMRGGPHRDNHLSAQQHSRPGAPRSQAQAIALKESVPEVDREKTCPLLLRVFTKTGGHHTVEDFAVRGKEPAQELQIYTWPDATLRELTDLVKEVEPSARRRDARLSFAFVYPDRRGRNVIRQVGYTSSIPRRGEDDNKMLQQLNFQTGDFLDVAILTS
eukprot:jgi/Chlat1/1934/Chrsp153S02242